MARLPQVLGTDDLALPELCAARLDGELIALAGGWVPIDEPDLPTLRALALAGRAEPLIIERMSAAWVHGGIVEVPTVSQFCMPSRSRVAVAARPGRQVREVAIDDDEIVQIGGCRCTTPLRTAFDLLRDPTGDDGLAARAVRGLVEAGVTDFDVIRRRLEASGRLPHKRLAAARLVLAELGSGATAPGPTSTAQPSLTR